MKKMKLTSGLSGVAGEYFVAAELSKLGYIATLTLKNSKGIDILVSDDKAKKAIAIQVKTAYGNSTKWEVGEKAEKHYADNLFYVFVNLNLNHGGKTDYYVVPSRTVARTVRAYYKKWLKTLGRQGQKHNENTMRTFIDKDKQYLEKWELLGL